MIKYLLIVFLSFVTSLFAFDSLQIVTAKSGLRMREYPNINARIISIIPFKENVEMIEEMDTIVTFENINGKWVKVKYNHIIGWVFGGFLKSFIHYEGPINSDFMSRSKLIPYKSNNKWGFCLDDGEVAIEPQYDEATEFSDNYGKDNYAAVKLNNKWGFINKKGILIVEPQYDEVNEFNHGYTAVKLNNKWGFINEEGVLTVKPQYDEVMRFSGGLAPVCIDNKWGYIDFNGNVVIEIKYISVSLFINNRAIVNYQGRKIVINEKGEEISTNK